MKKLLLVCVVIMTALMGVKAQKLESKALSGDDYLKGLEGSYIELFSQETCLNPKFDNFWKSEALKYVDTSKADSMIAFFQERCQGTKIGAEAVAYNKQNDYMLFCCAFLQGVKHIEVRDYRISGYDSNRKQLFSHKYHFAEKDANGNYIFESDDNNQDEFHYFWFMPDSPKSTYHIEFRYGNDKKQLSQLLEGKYAFWMAAGVRENHEDEWRNSIALFVEENFKGE